MKMITCPWTKFCLFKHIGGKPTRDINETVFTVYAGPGNDHDPLNHQKWNVGMQQYRSFSISLFFQIDLHPYKIAPPLFIKKSVESFTKETKDKSLTQAIHYIEKEIVNSDMTNGFEI